MTKTWWVAYFLDHSVYAMLRRGESVGLLLTISGVAKSVHDMSHVHKQPRVIYTPCGFIDAASASCKTKLHLFRVAVDSFYNLLLLF